MKTPILLLPLLAANACLIEMSPPPEEPAPRRVEITPSAAGPTPDAAAVPSTPPPGTPLVPGSAGVGADGAAAAPVPSSSPSP